MNRHLVLLDRLKDFSMFALRSNDYVSNVCIVREYVKELHVKDLGRKEQHERKTGLSTVL